MSTQPDKPSGDEKLISCLQGCGLLLSVVIVVLSVGVVLNLVVFHQPLTLRNITGQVGVCLLFAVIAFSRPHTWRTDGWLKRVAWGRKRRASRRAGEVSRRSKP